MSSPHTFTSADAMDTVPIFRMESIQSILAACSQLEREFLLTRLLGERQLCFRVHTIDAPSHQFSLPDGPPATVQQLHECIANSGFFAPHGRFSLYIHGDDHSDPLDPAVLLDPAVHSDLFAVPRLVNKVIFRSAADVATWQSTCVEDPISDLVIHFQQPAVEGILQNLTQSSRLSLENLVLQGCQIGPELAVQLASSLPEL